MLKPISLSLVACLAFTSCGVFQGSQTWSTVRSVRVDVRREGDPSGAYAARLSEHLTAAGIEHQVVTYQFRDRDRMGEEAIRTRTAVVYRDEANPRYPWWLMDERLDQPFWLPAGDLAYQISFYIRGRVELVETQRARPGSGGKTMAPPAVDDTHPDRARVNGERRSIAFRTKPSARNGEASRRVAAQEVAAIEKQRHAWLRARSARDTRRNAVRTGSTASATAFRAVHGTAFDPSSATDRRKMEQLRQSTRRVARAF